jgi:hypothetical protein
MYVFTFLLYISDISFQVQGAISGIRGDIKIKAHAAFSGHYKISAQRNVEQKEEEVKWLLGGQLAKFTYGGELNAKVSHNFIFIADDLISNILNRIKFTTRLRFMHMIFLWKLLRNSFSLGLEKQISLLIVPWFSKN